MEGDINGEGQNFSEGGFVKILAGGGTSPPLGETLHVTGFLYPHMIFINIILTSVRKYFSVKIRIIYKLVH